LHFVVGFPRSLLQPASDGVLQALNEAVIHAQQSVERPAADNFIAWLVVLDLIVQMRRSTDRPTAAGGHMRPR
jgi:hypothetical protein